MRALPELNSETIDESELRQWPLHYLRHLHIEMGQQCNVRCSMCYQTDFSPSARLPERAWKEHLYPAYPHLDSITLQGGEPTVLPNCRELLQILVREFPNVKLDTVTNGVLWKGLWEEAFLANGSCVNFSLNAIDPKLYEQIVQFGRQNEVVANIDRMVRRKGGLGSKVILRISTVVLTETIDELPLFVEWAAQHDLNQVIFHVDPVLSAKCNDTQRVQRRIGEAYEAADRNPQITVLALNEFDWFYASQYNLKPVRKRVLFERSQKPCPIPFDALFISYLGISRPCCKSWYPLGNLLDEPIEKVWNSDRSYIFRRRMLGLDFRDCLVSCDLNARPISQQHANARKAYWVFRREPRTAVSKLKRKLGLTNAQLDLPVLNNRNE